MDENMGNAGTVGNPSMQSTVRHGMTSKIIVVSTHIPSSSAEGYTPREPQQ